MKRERYYLDLFSGIGGFALGAYWAGLRFNKHYFSEIEPYAIELYQKRFPEAEPLGDIKNVDYSKLPKGEWLVTGGFPCQPHSIAGLKKASEDERDLWPECKRALCELRPTIALFENVTGLFNSEGGRFFNGILSDIHESGYAAEWQVISAAEVNAPHERKRIFIIAYTDSFNGEKRMGVYKKNNETLQKRNDNFLTRKLWLQTVIESAGKHDGVPYKLDESRGSGNAIVPQCAKMIFSLPAFDLFREYDPNP